MDDYARCVAIHTWSRPQNVESMRHSLQRQILAMLFRRKIFKWRRQDHGRAQAQTDVVRELGHVSHLIHIGSDKVLQG